ncbi:MAG TPA: cupin domain-containing protein [Chitinophagaceae bacterium]|nr:cupin domain-containing protein [Chitinophagaceae bacterium]
MSVNDYISSGVIEDYCLGLLNPEESDRVLQQAALMPEVKSLIEHYEQALLEYATENAFALSKNNKVKILGTLSNIKAEAAASTDDLPLLNKYSSHDNWLKIVKSVLPEKLEENMFVHQLRSDKGIEQILIWSKIDYPDEVHDNEEECFIILQGRCRCYVEDEVIELGPGEFFSIPMHKHHDVKVLEGPVMAVVQRIKVA